MWQHLPLVAKYVFIQKFSRPLLNNNQTTSQAHIPNYIRREKRKDFYYTLI